MLFLETLIGLLRRSAGKVIESIFGWAVAALFGEVRKDEKTLLSAVVAAVAFWPVLLLGIALPKVAAFVLALVPLPKGTPAELLRIVWAAAALTVPVAVGFVLQRRRGVRDWTLRNAIAGFPLTVGLSAAFLLAFVALPFQKLRAAMRGESEEHVTLIVADDDLEDAAAEIRRALDADGLAVAPARPPWLPRAIAFLLSRTAALVGKESGEPLFFRGPDLDLTLFPHGATVRGLPRATARAHAVIAGAALRTRALQTTDPDAQKLERRIQEAWAEARGRGGAGSMRRFAAIARELSLLTCPYDDWEIVYRETLQLGFALRGLADPIASPEARFHADARSRQRTRRLARRARGLTREQAAASASKSVTKLAQKMAERFLSGLRTH